MAFSQFGSKYLNDMGVLGLMEDLGNAVKQEGVIMLGGGNPSHIPQMEEILRERMGYMLDGTGEFEALIGNYDGPFGCQPFIEALVALFREDYQWDIDTRNVVLTNGSQTAFFYLFNLVAGIFPDGSHKKVLLPLTPEYIGYADAGLVDNLFVAHRPQIEFLDAPFFKYRVDFDQLAITDDIGAICVSRPTNPTGNVLSEDEMDRLVDLAKTYSIPLIVDNAYGTPFPGIIYTTARPRWEPHMILCMSLSKLGLPGARTGIVIADEPIVRAIAGMNAVISLAPGGLGATMALEMVRTREITRMSDEVIRPHYWRKAGQAVDRLCESLTGLNFHIHKPEGAFFLWLWIPDMPITCQILYERLKERGVLVVPGHHFFPGLEDEWQHRNECIRISYAGEDDMVYAGLQIIAEEVQKAYAHRN